MKISRLMPFKRNRKQHWEHIYEKSKSSELGWYQEYPEISLKLITSTGVCVDGNIIDIGGDTSKLAGILIDKGYRNLTVLDISGNSIERAKANMVKNRNKLIGRKCLKPEQIRYVYYFSLFYPFFYVRHHGSL